MKTKFTKMTGRLTQQKIEQLRVSALRDAKNFKEIKTIKSKSFDRLVRDNVKLNRIKDNIRRIENISGRVTGEESKKIARKFLGEKTTKQGKRNLNLSTTKQTQRLKNIERNLNKGKYKFTTIVKRTKQFQNVKKYIPKNATESEVLAALNREVFYYENKKLIMKYNKTAQEKGAFAARKSKAGQELQQEWAAYKMENNDLLKILLE